MHHQSTTLARRALVQRIAPVPPSPPIGVNGICDRCSEQAGLSQYWNGEFVCQVCEARMAREDARFGLNFGEDAR
jgi:hypothetical protein